MRDVRALDDKRSHWVVAGPGVPVQWTAALTRIVPGELIAWRSVAGSDVRHAGVVHFAPDGGGTHVRVKLSYVPPAGAFGHAVAARES